MSADINQPRLSFPETELDAEPATEAQSADIINFPTQRPETVTEPQQADSVRTELTWSDVEKRARFVAYHELQSKKAQKVLFNNSSVARGMRSTPARQPAHSQLKSHKEHLDD